MPLAKFAVLAVACAGCTVLTRRRRHCRRRACRKRARQRRAQTGAVPLARCLFDIARRTRSRTSRCRSRTRPVGANSAAATDARTPTPDVSAVDAGCTFEPKRAATDRWWSKWPIGNSTKVRAPARRMLQVTASPERCKAARRGRPGKIGPSGLDVDLPTTGFMNVPVAVLDTTKPYTATAWATFQRVDTFQTILAIDGKIEQAFNCKSTTDASRSRRARQTMERSLRFTFSVWRHPKSTIGTTWRPSTTARTLSSTSTECCKTRFPIPSLGRQLVTPSWDVVSTIRLWSISFLEQSTTFTCTKVLSHHPRLPRSRTRDDRPPQPRRRDPRTARSLCAATGGARSPVRGADRLLSDAAQYPSKIYAPCQFEYRVYVPGAILAEKADRAHGLSGWFALRRQRRRQVQHRDDGRQLELHRRDARNDPTVHQPR